MAIRVILAEDFALVRAGLLRLLREIPDVEVLGETGDGRDAVRLVSEKKPDVALMDISMPGLNGLEATAIIARDHPDTRVLILSMHANEVYYHRALEMGATGYLLKDASLHELEHALKAVARGERYLSPAVSRALMPPGMRKGPAWGKADPLRALTPRQREILQLIAEGHSTRAIAERLNLSAKTVETHRSRIMERLGIRDVPGLVRFAIRVGLVSAET